MGGRGCLLLLTAWALWTGPASGFQPFVAHLPSSRVAGSFCRTKPAEKPAGRDVLRAARRRPCLRMSASAVDESSDAVWLEDMIEGAVRPGVGKWRKIPDDGSVPVMCQESDPLSAEWQGAGEEAVRAFRAAATRSGRPLLSVYVGGSIARGEALLGLSTFRAWAYFAPATSGDSEGDGGAAFLLETLAAEEAAVRAAARDCAHAVRFPPAPVTRYLAASPPP